MSIAVLEQPPEQPIILWYDPSRDDIRRYVSEHNRRVASGEPLGWHEHLDVSKTTPFFGHKILSARVYSSHEAYKDGSSSGRAVKISDLDA